MGSSWHLDAILGTIGDARSSLAATRRLLLNPKFFRNGIVMLVLVVGTAALLFTWIQSSATADTGRLLAVPDRRPGRARSQTVIQQGDTLTVKPKGDRRRPTRVIVPSVLTERLPDDMHGGGQGRQPRRCRPTSTRREPAPDTSWLGLLLTGLLPLLVIGGFIFFMMRQAQGTNNQAMSASARAGPGCSSATRRSSRSTTWPASTRPRPSSRKSSSSSSTRRSSTRSARASRAACCWSGLPAPARR